MCEEDQHPHDAVYCSKNEPCTSAFYAASATIAPPGFIGGDKEDYVQNTDFLRIHHQVRELASLSQQRSL